MKYKVEFFISGFCCVLVIVGFIAGRLAESPLHDEGDAFACGYRFAFNPKMDDSCNHFRLKAVKQGLISQ